MKMRILYPLILAILFIPVQPARADSFFFHIDLFTPNYSFYPYHVDYWPVYDYPYSSFYDPYAYLHFHYPLIAYYYPVGYAFVPYFGYYPYSFRFYFHQYSHHRRYLAHSYSHAPYKKTIYRNTRYYFPDRKTRHYDYGYRKQKKYHYREYRPRDSYNHGRSDRKNRHDHRNAYGSVPYEKHRFSNRSTKNYSKHAEKRRYYSSPPERTGKAEKGRNNTGKSAYPGTGSYRGNQNRDHAIRDKRKITGHDRNIEKQRLNRSAYQAYREPGKTKNYRGEQSGRQYTPLTNLSDRDHRRNMRDAPRLNRDAYQSKHAPRAERQQRNSGNNTSRNSSNKRFKKKFDSRNGNHRSFRSSR